MDDNTNTMTPSLPRNENTNLSDSTHSSSASSSASRYSLDEDDRSPILLYSYRGKLSTSSQRDLCNMLDKDETLRLTRKPIPRLTSYLDIKRHDLFYDVEKSAYRDFPNFDSSLASVKVPSAAYWTRALGLAGSNYRDLYIVSPEGSPAGSVAGSEGAERRMISPTGSWGSEEGK